MTTEKLKRKIQRFINYYHLYKAIAATTFYRHPSRRLNVIGVTGTDGKTTTTHLIYHILKSNGKKVSMMSSVYAKIGDKEYDTGLHMTTPDSILVQKLLRYAANHGDEYFVLETTSHAFDQNRNWGVHYKVGVITNITPEHLDYHKSYENYLMTKAKIIPRSDITIINHDDESYERLVAYAKQKAAHVQTYGIKEKSDFQLDLKKQLKIQITDFNNYNYLAAYSVCRSLRLTEMEIFDAFKSFVLPKGRMDVVYNKEFKVIIDFAHTTNAFLQLLPGLKKEASGRVIHVFGAASERDESKRPLMGEASAGSSDVIIITEEDYRHENPKKIAEEIAEGIKKHKFTNIGSADLNRKSSKVYALIIDRGEAIRKAIEIAGKGDIVICTGKSHEKSLARNGVEHPWDEYKVVLDAVSVKKTS